MNFIETPPADLTALFINAGADTVFCVDFDAAVKKKRQKGTSATAPARAAAWLESIIAGAWRARHSRNGDTPPMILVIGDSHLRFPERERFRRAGAHVYVRKSEESSQPFSALINRLRVSAEEDAPRRLDRAVINRMPRASKDERAAVIQALAEHGPRLPEETVRALARGVTDEPAVVGPGQHHSSDGAGA
jgi:hypothetical protein